MAGLSGWGPECLDLCSSKKGVSLHTNVTVQGTQNTGQSTNNDPTGGFSAWSWDSYGLVHELEDQVLREDMCSWDIWTTNSQTRLQKDPIHIHICGHLWLFIDAGHIQRVTRTPEIVSHYKHLYLRPRPLLGMLWPEVVTENNHIAPWASFLELLDPKPG